MKPEPEEPLRLGIMPVALIIGLGFLAMLGIPLLVNPFFEWIVWLASWLEF